MANGAAEDVRTANTDGWTPVYVAAAGGHMELLALLETLGAASMPESTIRFKFTFE